MTGGPDGGGRDAGIVFRRDGRREVLPARRTDDATAPGAEPLVLGGVQARAFESCVAVGAAGLDDAARDRVEAAVSNGVGLHRRVYAIPPCTADDVRAAFTVGWEGLEGDAADTFGKAADEVAAILGVTPGTPAP